MDKNIARKIRNPFSGEVWFCLPDFLNSLKNFFVQEAIQQKLAGRNDPCPCGSEIKFKKCCWGK